MISLTEIQQTIHTDLTSYQDLVNLLTHGMQSIRILVGEQAVGDVFVTYSFTYEQMLTKGYLANYKVIINSWGFNELSSLQVADNVTNAFNASSHSYEYLGAEIQQTENYQIYTQQIFNLKK